MIKTKKIDFNKRQLSSLAMFGVNLVGVLLVMILQSCSVALIKYAPKGDNLIYQKGAPAIVVDNSDLSIVANYDGQDYEYDYVKFKLKIKNKMDGTKSTGDLGKDVHRLDILLDNIKLVTAQGNEIKSVNPNQIISLNESMLKHTEETYRLTFGTEALLAILAIPVLLDTSSDNAANRKHTVDQIKQQDQQRMQMEEDINHYREKIKYWKENSIQDHTLLANEELVGDVYFYAGMPLEKDMSDASLIVKINGKDYLFPFVRDPLK